MFNLSSECPDAFTEKLVIGGVSAGIIAGPAAAVVGTGYAARAAATGAAAGAGGAGAVAREMTNQAADDGFYFVLKNVFPACFVQLFQLCSDLFGIEDQCVKKGRIVLSLRDQCL